ncbi:mucin-associated surface protein (MASP) [Trypanosoma rangeli]|uniref:Mucin-associated surface protein (MASP) n=1 Tax=Trypanosoma rangeli TaxID=5698 RepID=A0A422MQP4_TRYRA|nr:mucin-associated surface protein (MASP) [Trypanosoma rangeli]RNE95521.1 mucin-associated surface protein (MASP) [Trypanosoma rangeli]|eukprot:RNE95521.1 mucin-associated surface protein (MASP) [Trypanosoma rangeli]
MAGRVLLVCALCVLCCCGGGVYAWHDYCNERDWSDFNSFILQAKKTDADVDKYCGHNKTFVQLIKDNLAKAAASKSTETNSQGTKEVKGNGAEGPQPTAATGADEPNSSAKETVTPPAANAATKTTKATHGDSDGSTAASHCTSPLALLMLLACGAAAATAAA